MSDMVIGFIGLGDMGGPMAGHIAASGAPMVAYDASATREAPAGARRVGSVAEVAQIADVIFLSLPDGTVSKAVAEQIVAAPGRRATAVVELSTIGPAAARQLDVRLAENGLTFVDSPVSGGRTGAIKGTIAVMWSGPAALLERLRGVMESFSGSVFMVGPTPGQGQALKLLNNYLSATAMVATSEAMLFGRRFGLDMGTMLDVVNVSTGRNTATSDKFPNRILTETYDAGFRMALMAKDVALYLDEVKKAGTACEVGEQVAAYWRQALGTFPDGDFTEVYKVLAAEMKTLEPA